MLLPRMEARALELKRYVRFTDEDAARLGAYATRARPHFPRIAAEFYERIREHEEAHDVFTGEEQIGRLQRSMNGWLERAFGGLYDDVYFAKTEHIGRVHVKVGLPQRYMPLAMALIRASLTTVILNDDSLTSADAHALVDSLSRLLDIELTVMLESYRSHFVARIERALRTEVDEASRRATFMEEVSVQAIDLAPSLVVGLDAEGGIVLFNREAERLTGYAQDEVLGRAFVDLFLPDDIRDRETKMFEAGTTLEKSDSRGRMEQTRDLPLRMRQGKVRSVRWQVVRTPAIERPHGDDITALSTHEQQRHKVATFLFGDDVTDVAIERDRLDQQRRLASLGTLAAGLAHEIRNPLNGAKLHTSFLERTLSKTGSPDVLEAVRTVKSELQRLAHLVTDFLDYAQPRTLSLSSVSVRVLCERAIQLLVASGTVPPSVTITTDLPNADITIEVDTQRIEQVLGNLLENAVESIVSAKRQGEVTLRARREPFSVCIEVEDNGPGFPAGDLPPLFDAFYSTKPTGTGLGLSIVHRIVTDHGGTIDVQSRDGTTRFRLKIPLRSSEIVKETDAK